MNFKLGRFLKRIVLFFTALITPVYARAVETALGEADNFGELVTLIWSWSSKVILTISVLTLIVAGFMHMSAGGDEEKLLKSKEVGVGAIVASTIVLFSGVLKNLLQKPAGNLQAGQAELTDLPDVIQNSANLLLVYVSGFAVLVLIFNGIQYMRANGESEKINAAKRNSKYAIFGLGLALVAYFIIGFVIKFFVA